MTELRNQIDAVDDFRPHPTRNSTNLILSATSNTLELATQIRQAVPMEVMPLGRPCTVGIVSLNPDVPSTNLVEALRDLDKQYVEAFLTQLSCLCASTLDTEQLEIAEEMNVSPEEYVQSLRADVRTALGRGLTIEGYSLSSLKDAAAVWRQLWRFAQAEHNDALNALPNGDLSIQELGKLPLSVLEEISVEDVERQAADYHAHIQNPLQDEWDAFKARRDQDRPFGGM